MTAKFLDTNINYAGRLVQNGMMLKDAAAAIGCHPTTLGKELRVRSVNTSKGKAQSGKKLILPLPEAEIIEAYRNLVSIKELAERYGVSNTPINGILRRNRIKQRTLAEANAIAASLRSEGQRAFEMQRARSGNAQKIINSANQGIASIHVGAGEAGDNGYPAPERYAGCAATNGRSLPH